MRRYMGLMASWVGAVHWTESLPLLTLWELTITVASSVSLLFLPLLPFTWTPSILCFPLCALSSSLFLLNATSGGFSYSRMQSSHQSPLSYSLHQGPRARTQSSDINEALYNLDRVLHGKSAAIRAWLCLPAVMNSLLLWCFWIQLRCVSHTVLCHLALNVLIFADVQA